MQNIKAIIRVIDSRLEAEGKSTTDPVEANSWLCQQGVLSDSKDRPGKPLRDILRAGGIPHAYQSGGKGTSWIIPHSRKNAYPVKQQSMSIIEQSANDSQHDAKYLKSNVDCLGDWINELHFRGAGEIDQLVPNHAGLYCVRIQEVHQLPVQYRDALLVRKHNIMYIGIASKSLKTRFLGQELRAKGHGTLFRSIGAMLGYLPPKGSLLGKANKRNYKFSADVERQVIEWINKNLVVNWIVYDGDFETIETALIVRHRPLLNIDKNPDALEILKRARAECVRIANLI